VFAAGLVLGGGLIGLLWRRAAPREIAVHIPGVPDPLHTEPNQYVWTDHPAPLFPVPPYARHLRGVDVVIDPGHIGQRDRGGTWKRGPTGLREAEVNLRVAEFLRNFLRSVGAEATLTREMDRSLGLTDDDDLASRVRVANERRADLFLSIHHNGHDKPEPNFTSLFFHDSPEHSRASVCAALHLLTGLSDALRLEQHLDAGVLNDELLYKNGLAVLRQARTPAVLSEASFHSNPAEEARLRDPVYNRREAYGLFLGLARWAQAGLPRVRLASGQERAVRAGREITLQLDDGLRGRGGWGTDRFDVLRESIEVRLNGDVLEHAYDGVSERLRVTIPRAARPGPRELYVGFQNAYGQHVLHPLVGIEVQRP
jgi:N-acetylmuramoyl-L-alanine amidase